MFKKNFENICSQRGVSPTSVLRSIGISTSTYSLWTDSSIPRNTTLLKIANNLNVTVEDLLKEESPTPAPTEKEKDAALAGDVDEKRSYLIKLYQSCDEEGRDRLLRQAEQILLDRMRGK